jgi:hypothetical protein
VVLRLARSAARCPRCGHDDVRRSKRPRGALLRLLGLHRHRCMACNALILAPAPRPAVPDSVA